MAVKEEIKKLQSRLTLKKSLFSKSLISYYGDLDRFKSAKSVAAEARVKTLAGEALNSIGISKNKLKMVKEVGQLLIEAINNAGSAIEGSDDLAVTVETDLNGYDSKVRKFELDYHNIIHEISKKDEIVVVQKSGTNSEGWQAFKPNASLKPNHLEKKSSALDVNAFTKQFESPWMGSRGGQRRRAFIFTCSPCGIRSFGIP